MLVDEIDKMTCRDQVLLLNVMETHSERNHTMDAADLPHASNLSMIFEEEATREITILA
jgi:hypothetical protein